MDTYHGRMQTSLSCTHTHTHTHVHTPFHLYSRNPYLITQFSYTSLELLYVMSLCLFIMYIQYICVSHVLSVVTISQIKKFKNVKWSQPLMKISNFQLDQPVIVPSGCSEVNLRSKLISFIFIILALMFMYGHHVLVRQLNWPSVARNHLRPFPVVINI